MVIFLKNQDTNLSEPYLSCVLCSLIVCLFIFKYNVLYNIYVGVHYEWYAVTYVAGKRPFRFPISPFHQCSSDRSVTVITSPRRKSSSPDSCGTKSYNACTKTYNRKRIKCISNSIYNMIRKI